MPGEDELTITGVDERRAGEVTARTGELAVAVRVPIDTPAEVKYLRPGAIVPVVCAGCSRVARP